MAITPCFRKFLVVVLLSIASAHPGFADDPGLPLRSCSTTLTNVPATPYPSAISRASTSASLILKDAPVKNQGGYGCCWISSALGKWERLVAEKFGRTIPLSEDHLILSSLFYRVEEGLYFGKKISQGGWMESADWMATHIGLIPESACAWKINLRDKMVGSELIGYLNFEIANFQSVLKQMKTAGATEDAAWEYAKTTKSRLLKELRNRVGNFPSKFIVDGKEYTPHSFAAAIAPAEKKLLRVEISPTEPRVARQKPLEGEVLTKENSLQGLYPTFWKRLPVSSNKFVVSDGIKKRDLSAYRLFGKSHGELFEAAEIPLKEMHSTIETSLKEGQPVYLATAMAKEFYQRDTGLMSLAAYGGTAETAKAAKFSGGHAILITGRYADSAGNLLGYRIQNSWGPGSGSIGYYTMDVDYFDAFVDSIVVTKDITK